MNDIRQLTVAVVAGDYRGPPPAGRDLLEVSGIDSFHTALVFTNPSQLLESH